MFNLSFSVPMEIEGCHSLFECFLLLLFNVSLSPSSLPLLSSPLLKSYTTNLKHLCYVFSSHFCEYLVKLICYCLFFTFLCRYIDSFLFLFCEKATPVLLLEIANQRVFCHFSSFRECVKLVILEALQIYPFHLFIA